MDRGSTSPRVGHVTAQQPPVLHEIVIAGGGVAGLEALIALHQLAGDRVSTTLLSPAAEYLVRALSVQDPFARPAPRRHSPLSGSAPTTPPASSRTASPP